MRSNTIFPRISLDEALPFAKKLVSKTHVAPQSAEIILPGVFGSSNPLAQVKASALKQFGLLEGKSSAYSATGLAKAINAAPDGERVVLLRQACLKPKVFNLLFQTFHGDSVPLSKLRQQAATAGVHPDFQDSCVQLFAKSAECAGLGTRSGDAIQLVTLSEVEHKVHNPSHSELDEDKELSTFEESEEAATELDPPENHEVNEDKVNEEQDAEGKPKEGSGVRESAKSARAVINVNVTLDSSLDTEKLERQLALLRKYGAI